MEPYYQRGEVTLYHGDCQQVIVDNMLGAHIVVTSPPYNMGANPGANDPGYVSTSKGIGAGRASYDQHDDDMPPRAYDDWQREVLRLLWQTLPSDGAIFYNHRQRVTTGSLHMPLNMDFPIPLRQIITWDRGTGIETSTRYFCIVAEWVLLFAQEKFRIPLSESGRGDIWHLGFADKRKWNHPAPFPLALPQRCIQASAARSVLDPFAGSGTTLVAAAYADIPGIGIEKSERYCELIARRIDHAFVSDLNNWRSVAR